MKKVIKSIFIAVSSLAVLSACEQDLSPIQERIDNLDAGVTYMERLIGALNSNVEALQKMAAGNTVFSVDQATPGVYTVVFSNGETATLDQGNLGTCAAPSMSVDKDGYWMCDVRDGKGPQYVLDASGKKVSAVGLDGTTPSFSTDKDGYWTVSFDSKTYSQVLDAAGKPVSALPGSSAGESSYFENVEVSSNSLKLTMKNGDVYEVPVVSGFYCAVNGVEGTVNFDALQTKSFEVEMTGVASKVITAPYGWTAVLTDSLRITAPALSKAKDYLADSSSEVCILAISESGYTTVAKVKVFLNGSVVVEKPTVSVTSGTISSDSATFNVITANADKWYYIFQKASLDAPMDAVVVSTGTLGSGKSLSFDDVDENESYTLYAVSVSGDTRSSMSSVTVKIPSSVVNVDLWAKWEAGESIDICGESFSKATYTAKLLTADGEEVALQSHIHGPTVGGVIFLDTKNGGAFVIEPTGTNIQMSASKVVLIGRSTSDPALVKYAASEKLTQFRGCDFYARNITLDLRAAIQTSRLSPLTFYNVQSKACWFDGCVIYPHKAIAYNNAASTCYCSEDLRVMNSFICVNQNEKLCKLFGLDKAAHGDVLKKVVFENNIVYSKESYPFSVVFTSGAAAAGQATAVSICNNTFYNTSFSSGLYLCDGASTFVVKKNIFYKVAETADGFLCNTYKATPSEVAPLIEDNIVFTSGKVTAFGAKSTYQLSSGNELTKITAEPFSKVKPGSRKFVPVASYSSYGAQR